MKFLYEVGQLKIFEYEGLTAAIFTHTITHPHLDIIGAHIDKKGVVKRIRRDSEYGRKVLEILGQPPEVLSQDMARLHEITAMLAGKMDIGRVGR